MVEADCGHGLAQTVARDLVVFVQRQADQAQLSSALAQRMADREPIRQAQRWASDNLHHVASVEDLAAHAHMSPRNFSRLFKAQTGMTPGRYLRQLRVEAAQRRLQQLDGAAEKVASQVGFGSARSLRRSLRAIAGAGPPQA
jgi:transcriptional regulator GlxA family with amidase domain